MNDDTQQIMRMLRAGACCSQVIVELGLALRKEENETLVAASSGLCMGLHTGQVCGALSAACLVLAMYDSKNAAAYMIPQLMEWYEEIFGARYGGADCLDICGGTLQAERCRELVIRVWEQVRLLLDEFGFDVET